MCDALLKQKSGKVELIFTEYMKKNDQHKRYLCPETNERKFLSWIAAWYSGIQRELVSNVKSGIRRRIRGYSDRIEDEDVGIVIEVKYADDENLQGECEKSTSADYRYQIY